jgi:hypothetical protein
LLENSGGFDTYTVASIGKAIGAEGYTCNFTACTTTGEDLALNEIPAWVYNFTLYGFVAPRRGARRVKEMG